MNIIFICHFCSQVKVILMMLSSTITLFIAFRLLTHIYITVDYVQAQECVVSVIQSLCDTEVTLLPPPGTTLVGGGGGDPGSMPTPDVYLANALPPRDLLVTMCTVMLEHVANIEHSFTTLLPTVRTFLMLTEHDYGFYHLKR